MLERAGVVPAVVDVFDASALTAAVLAAQPVVIIHQLTDLPREFDEAQLVASGPKNARIRSEGTRNLIAAAQAAGTPSLHRPKHCRLPMRLAASRIPRPIRSTSEIRPGRSR